ncbi:MAG: hypothetical protein RL511_837 [Bacteroidota bacterium]
MYGYWQTICWKSRFRESLLMAIFAFKDFKVCHAQSPLKVSTDAILLGASVKIQRANPSVLDVGTGSGVIALLLASRFPDANITGIDPNPGAFADAQMNFSDSKFAQRLTALHCDLAALPKDIKYDVIVSNPPYFLDSLPSSDAAGQDAKHITRQAFFELFNDMMQRCKEDGQIWLILPAGLAEEAQSFFKRNAWQLGAKIQFHASPNKLNKFGVLCFQRQVKNCVVKELTIRQTDGSYHADYKKIAGPYHDRSL